MAKQNKAKKRDNLGKGQITPIQIAFIVDQYLADNNFTNTHSAFRTEASDIFSKTKVKEVPKGLMGLGDILDEYISLKAQRVMVDQEKLRVETALHGIQDVMKVYHSAGRTTVPSHPLPSPAMAMPVAPAVNPSNGSPPGHALHTTLVMNSVQPPMLPFKDEPKNFSTPVANPSSGTKRKALKPVSKVPPAPKKSCTRSSTGSLVTGGIKLPSQITSTNNTEEATGKLSVGQSASIDYPPIKSPVQGSSVAKSLFKQPPGPRTNSTSPKTPPQPSPSQADKSVSPLENSSLHSTDASTSREIITSNCSVVSSKTIIVSPLKCTGYYSVERSYHVSSPFKSNAKKLGKRDHVKGRLDFDDSDVPMSSEEPVATDNSISSTNENAFEIDLPDFDVFDGDFSFSDLLLDLDLDCEGVAFPCQTSSTPFAGFIQRSENDLQSGCLESNQAVSDSCLSTVTGVLSEKDMNIQGPDSIMSVKTITKCIKILSPAKTRRSSSLQQANSPARAYQVLG